jgi:L-arabinokinase
MIEVMHAVMSRRPEASIAVRSAAPRRLFERTLPGHIEVFDVECDTGMVQTDSLHLDGAASIRRAAAFHARLAEKADTEATYLLRSGATVVVGDIPPLAFAAAAQAGLPSVAIGNFTWDWIYEGYPEPFDSPPRGSLRAGNWIQTIRDAYRHATVALRLPMAAGFAGLEAVTRDIPFVARRSRHASAEIRRTLGIPGGKPVLLMSFSAYGLAGLDTAALAKLGGYTIVTTTPAPGLLSVAEERLYERGYRYEDLVHAADVVVTKPGYGIISEAIANDAAILYTARGNFPEYDLLVREMPKYLRVQFIEQEDLVAGRWGPALESLLAQPKPSTKPDLNGAEIAAQHLLDFF